MPKLSGINHKQAIKAFEKAGFHVIRQSKHIIMSNGEVILTIPRNNPVNAITMGILIKSSVLSIEEFKKLL